MSLSAERHNLEASLEDLMRVPTKAELVGGQIVYMPPTGDEPGYAGDEVYSSLRQYVREGHPGRAVSDNKGFHVELPHRKSVSPDAAYYTGPRTGMRFFDGPPDFAVEVRSERDYGPQAERDMAEKRADFFAAGTRVVWDVDLLGPDTVRKYTADDPARPTVFRRGEVANAEPAVPCWRMNVDDLFE
jgi:Uma2 family endonuclease